MQSLLKIISGMANSVDPEQTAPKGAVWSGSEIIAYAILPVTIISLCVNALFPMLLQFAYPFKIEAFFLVPQVLINSLHCFWSPKYSSTVFIASAGLGGSVGCHWTPGGRGFNPRRGRQHSFVETDHEIFSTVILSLPLIQEGQLSVSGERMCTVLVNRLED